MYNVRNDLIINLSLIRKYYRSGSFCAYRDETGKVRLNMVLPARRSGGGPDIKYINDCSTFINDMKH